MSQVAIQVKDLRVVYKRRTALDGVTLSLGTGVHGLLGPNGAGKTTLMRILATALRPERGSVRVLNHDIGTAAGRINVRRRLGYLPQTFGYYRNFTVNEFVEYCAWLKEVPPSTLLAAVGEAVERVGLSDRRNSKMKSLSGGMIRRVGIAQAIVNDPDILLLDEPTAGLDPGQLVDFRRLLRQLGVGGTVLLSTHLVEDVTAVCAGVTLLDGGRVAFTGTPAELAQQGASSASQMEGGSAAELGYAEALNRARRVTTR